MDELCDSIIDMSINKRNEYDELINNINNINRMRYDMLECKRVLIRTDKRYKRYLSDIFNWLNESSIIVNVGKSYYDIVEDNICRFLEIENSEKNLISKLELMYTIDMQIYNILQYLINN